MTEEQQPKPPQPILIQGGGIEPSENDPPTQDDAPQPTPNETAASPDDGQTNPTNRLAEAIERYEALKSRSDPGNALVVLGLVLMAISLFIGVTTVMGAFSGGSGDGVTLCFGGLFIGLLVCVGGVAQSASYQGELKKTLAEIKSLANLPQKKKTPSYVLQFCILCALGILVIGMFEEPVGFILLLWGLSTLFYGALTGYTSEKHEDVLAAAKKEVLRRNG
tara:strand:- start:1061 stop:1723 length:663 start_codon:yes stop_codon:yes gene_type:complete